MSTFLERWRKLSVYGCVGAILYLLVAAIFWTDAMFDRTPVVQFQLYASLAGLTLLYLIGIPRVRHESLRTVIVFAVIFAVLGFITVPFDSTDVFFYIAHGWAQTHYNGNPYSQVLRDIPGSLQDPMIGTRWMKLNRNPWLDEPLPYGFAFALVIRAIAWLGDGNLWLTLLLFNILNFSVHAIIAWLLWRIASQIPGADPKLVLYLYAWSPLVVLQYLANVHNDIIMAALIVVAFYLKITDRDVWALPTLVMAGFVKYVAFALVPFSLAFTLRRHGWKTAAKSLCLSSVVATVVSLPYIWDIRSFKLQRVFAQLSESSGSLHSFVTFAYRAIARTFSSQPVQLASFGATTNVVLWTAVAAFILYQFCRAWRGRDDGAEDMATRWTSVLFSVIFIGSSQFYIWYIGMLFPLAVLTAGRSVWTDIVVLLSCTHMVFMFLRGKATGYFLVATVLPVTLLLWRWHKTGLSVVKTS